jgi:hypothetical protein
MPNQSGSVYGLTILSPIKDDPQAEISHNLAIRMYLSTLPRHRNSPFAKVSSTHFARLVVMDDVVYEGMPSCEEHLKRQYLIFESNFDGDLDTYLRAMASEIGDEVHEVWQHCIGYPGVSDVNLFVAYMKKCQIETTFYFAAVNDKTVPETLVALQTQSAVAAFIEKHQGQPVAVVQKAFGELVQFLRSAPPPAPAAVQAKEFTDEII